MVDLSTTPQQKETSAFIRTAIMASVCFLLVHLMLIFRFAPFGDEVWDLSGKCWGIYLAGGRYTVTLFRVIFSECGVPVAYGITSSIFFGLAMAIQMKILRIENVWNQFIYTGFTVSCIQLSYLMVVAYHADSILFGLFAMSLAYWMYERYLQASGKRLIVYSSILAALGLGSYQFFGLLLPCFFLLKLLINRDEHTSTLAAIFKKACHFALWCIMILVLYCAFSSLGKLFCQEEDLALTSSYQHSLIMWGRMDVITNILHIGKQLTLHLLGLSYPGEWIYGTTLLPLFLLMKDIWQGKKIRSLRHVYVLIPMAVYLIPFIPLAIFGTESGARCYIAQPLACAAVWCLAIRPRIKQIKPWVAASISVFIMLKASYVVSDRAFHQTRLHEQAMVLRSEIVSRALALDVPDGVDANACPIVVNGNLYTAIREKDIYGSCIPAAGSGHLEEYLDLTGIRYAGQDKQKLAPIFKNMQLYPQTGSIKYHEGNILVKLR